MQQWIEGWSWQDILRSPIYWYQVSRVKRQTVILPTPVSEKTGIEALQQTVSKQPHPSLKLLILGDSAAAGVGVAEYTDALLGQLIKTIATKTAIAQSYRELQWQMAAVSGFTSVDVLRQLYVMPSYPTDVVVINVGVNDVVKNTRTVDWQANLQAIIQLAQRKFFAKHIIFIRLPPMQLMPALPSPLNQFIGKKSNMLDEQLQQLIKGYQTQDKYLDKQVHYLSVTFDGRWDKTQLFAKDGFHPSAKTYTLIAEQLTDYIAAILTDSHYPNKQRQ